LLCIGSLFAQTESKFGPLESKLSPHTEGDWTIARPADSLLIHNDSNPKAIKYFLSPTSRSADELVFQTRVRASNSGENAGAGILFDHTVSSNNKSSYWAFITDGETVSIYQRNRFGLFLTHQSALSQSEKALDTSLRVVRRGNKADFYVNDHRLTRLQSDKLSGGSAGLIAIGSLSAFVYEYQQHSANTLLSTWADDLPGLANIDSPFEGLRDELRSSIEDWSNTRFVVMPVEIDGKNSTPEFLQHETIIRTLSTVLPDVVTFNEMRNVALASMPDRSIPSVFNLDFIKKLSSESKATHLLFSKFQPDSNTWLRITRVMDAKSLNVVHSVGTTLQFLDSGRSESKDTEISASETETEPATKPTVPTKDTEISKTETHEVETSPSASESGEEDEYSEEGLIHLGSVLGVFFHEMGHAVINEFAVPAVGPQEDIADEYAAFTFSESMEEDPSPAMALMSSAAAYTYLAQARKNRLGGFAVPWFDEHSPNLNRFSKMMCILYGATPNVFEEVMNSVEIPERNRKKCIGEYKTKRNSWHQLLRPYRRAISDSQPGDHSPDALGAKIKVVYGEEKKEYSKIIGPILRELRLFEDIAEDLNKQYVWERELTLFIGECDTINAFYSRDEATVVMCYELIEAFGNDTIEFMQGSSASSVTKTTSASKEPRSKEETTELLHRYLVGNWRGELTLEELRVDSLYRLEADGNYTVQRLYSDIDFYLEEKGTWHIQSFDDDTVTIHHHPTKWIPEEYCVDGGCEIFDLDVRDSSFELIDEDHVKVDGKGVLERRS